MHCEGIWNDLELQKINWKHNVSKACIIAVFETISNFKKNIKTWKHGRLRVQYDTFWYDILTCSCNFENNEAKWCILTLFETYARRLLGDSIVLPFIFIDFLNEV